MVPNNAVFSQKVAGFLKRSVKTSAFKIVLLTIIMVIIIQITTNNFFSSYSITAFVRQSTFIIIIGLAQTFVLLTSGIDLSVASIAGLSSMVFALIVKQGGGNPLLATVIGLIVGTLLGLFNGLFICGLNIPPFIVTLSTSYLFRGVIYVATKGMAITGIPKSLMSIGSGNLFGFLPYPTLVMICLAIILALILKFTTFGVRLYALGGNENAAKIVGIHTKGLKMAVYAISGFLCSIVGILMILRFGSSQLNIGGNLVMPSITAAVIGGTSMSGGSGGVGGTVAGGFFMGTIVFSISMFSISAYWDDIMTGAVVLLVLSIDAIYRIKKASY